MVPDASDVTPRNPYWQQWFDTSVHAYWKGDLAAGMEACERLAASDDIPENIIWQARRNQAFYSPMAPQLVPGTTITRVTVPVQKEWAEFNPSIIRDGDGFLMNLRSSNYKYNKGHYIFIDPDQVIRTTNYLVRLDRHLQVRSSEAIEDRTDHSGLSTFPVAGFEDVRLFRWRDRLWGTATARNRNPQGICEQMLLTIEDCAFVDALPLSDWTLGTHEKNWMPTVDGDRLLFVHSCSPTTVFSFNPDSRGVELETQHPALPIARHLRGGSPLHRLDDGWLTVVHESVVFEDYSRVYPHRFVKFDNDFRMVKITKPFYFIERSVEYAAGLTEMDGDLYVSFGFWDREAYVAKMPLDGVIAALEDLPLPLTEEDGAPPAIQASEAPREDVAMITPAVPEIQAISFARRPAIVSMTMTANNATAVREALSSVVDWVDACVLVDTGITDDTIEVARDVAGDKLQVTTFPWQNDFAAARNHALAAAAATGADWALTLDSDERMAQVPADIRDWLSALTGDLVHVRHGDGNYAKERFFRLPSTGRWKGPTHEAFVISSFATEHPTMRFLETPKNEEDYQRKFRRDAEILKKFTAENPTDPRWWYYLGDSLQNMREYEQAAEAYDRCWSLDGWDEESAWSMYRAAESYFQLGRYNDAVLACAKGLTRHAGIPELAWYAAYISNRQGNHRDAVGWARMAIAIGNTVEDSPRQHRIGFSYLPGQYEGPYDVLRFSLRQLGDTAGADAAEAKHAEAIKMREARTGSTGA